eukprot:g2229.t2
MDWVKGVKGTPVEGERPFTTPAEAPQPTAGSKHGTDPSRTTLPDANAGAAAASTASTAERYPSHIRRRCTGMGGLGEEDDQERDTEKGYVGGDRVRLLVGSFNVGNSPLTDLAPWLPYGGKGFDLIVVGLQESTYRVTAAAAISPSVESGGGGGGDGAVGGRGINVEGGDASTARATAGMGGAAARGAVNRHLETSSAGDKNETGDAAAAEGTGPGGGTKAVGRGGKGAGSSGTGALRRETLEGGKHALDATSPPDSVACTPDPSAQDSSSIVAATKVASNAPPTTAAPTTRATLTAAAAAAAASAAAATATTATRTTSTSSTGGGGSHGGGAAPPGVSPCAPASAAPAAVPPSGGGIDDSKRRTTTSSSSSSSSSSRNSSRSSSRSRSPKQEGMATTPGGEKRKSMRRFWGPTSSRYPNTTSAPGEAPRAAAGAPAEVVAVAVAEAGAGAGAGEGAGTGQQVEDAGLGGEAGARGEVTTPDEAGQPRILSGVSSLPREESRWELGSGPDFLRDSYTPTTTPTRTSMGATRELSGSAGGGGNGTTAAGKDQGRFSRARKAVKKRTKELDAGAAHLRAKLSGHLGPDFEQVISLRRMQMRVKVFLRRSLLDVYDHEEGESAAENTGLGKVVANKGGLVCKLRLRGTTLCFVSCHLQAHEGQNHLARRNSSCAEILQGARLGDRRVVDVDSQFHHVFWLGDMNYRINFGLGLQPEEQHARVTALVKASDWPKLWEADELLRELRAGRLLTGFQTEPPAFAPTFKGVRGAISGYSTKRIPSYTDRILWKSLPGHAPNLELLEFVSFPEITSSDHKPIHAAFNVKLTPEVGAPSPEKKLFGRRPKIPISVDVPRMAAPPPRLLFEDLEASGLPGIAGGGVRNPFVVFSSDPKHLVKISSTGKPRFKTEVKKKTLNPRWGKRYGCQLSVTDPTLLRLSHISLLVMDKERGPKAKGELLGVANLSLAEVLWINTNRPAGNRRGSPSSTGAAGANANAYAGSSFSRRRPSLPLRRRSLSPERARRDSHAPGQEVREDRERASTGAGAGEGGPVVEGGRARAASSHQRPGGMRRHRSHSSLPWSFFRPRSASLSSRDGSAGAGGGGGGGGGGEAAEGAAAASFAAPGKANDLQQQRQEQLSSDGGGGGEENDTFANAHLTAEKQTAVGTEAGHGIAASVAPPGAAAAAAAAAAVSPSTTPGSHIHRGASTRSMGSTATADSKEGLRDGGGSSGGGGYGRSSAFFFQSVPGHTRHVEDDRQQRAAGGGGGGGGGGGPMFDLPLVKNGLPRGRIRGRCTLVLGSSSGGALLRLGSVGALSVGGVASVGGVGVAGGDRGDEGDRGGPLSSLGAGAAGGGGGGGGKKRLGRFFTGGSGRRGRSRSASYGSMNRSRHGSDSGSGSGSRSPVHKRGIFDHAATFPPRSANSGSGAAGRAGGGGGGTAEANGRSRLSAKSKSDAARYSSRRLGDGEGRHSSNPSGCHRHPTKSGSSSFGLSSAVAHVHAAAHITVSDDLANEEQARMMEEMVGRTGHLADEPKSEAFIDSTNKPATPTAGTAVLAAATDVFAEHVAGEMAQSLRSKVEGEMRLETGRRRRLRAPLQPLRKLESINNPNNGNNDIDDNNKEHGEEHGNIAFAGGVGLSVIEGGVGEGDVGEGAAMVKFRLGGRVESFMVGNVMQDYLNQLVAESVAATENQTCNIAFVKTHKTASTTAATIFYRYGKRHNLNVANFDGHQSSIELPDAVKQIQESGKPVDLMHYHHAWDGFYEGRWDKAKAAYRKIMRDPSNMKLVTVMREPVSHYLSYYYYFLQPEVGLSITEYMELSKSPEDPRYRAAFQRRNDNVGWHGFKLLHNPLCAEFGIRTAQELDDFIANDLPEFAMILLTEQFEEGLAVFMRMFNWRPIDMTYCRVIETKAGVARYDGKMLADVPKIRDLPSEVVTEIKRQTQLDQALYKAAVKIYLEKRAPYEDRLEADVRRIRTVQSAVHGYLEFDPNSPAHEW